MKKPKVEQINLPYASTVASFYGDQSAVQGNSFLGKMFKGGGRTLVTKNFAPQSPAKAMAPNSVSPGTISQAKTGGFYNGR